MDSSNVVYFTVHNLYYTSVLKVRFYYLFIQQPGILRTPGASGWQVRCLRTPWTPAPLIVGAPQVSQVSTFGTPQGQIYL